MNNEMPSLNKPYSSKYKFIESVNNKSKIINEKLKKNKIQNYKIDKSNFVSNKSNSKVLTKNDQIQQNSEKNCLLF